MVLFCIVMCGSTLFCSSSSVWAVVRSPSWEAWVMSTPRLTWCSCRVWGKQCTASSNLPAEPVAAFCGLKRMLYKMGWGWGRSRRETICSQRWCRLYSKKKKKNMTRDKSTDLIDLASGLVVFSQIKSFGHNDETTQQGAYLSLTQLQYKTVRKRL